MKIKKYILIFFVVLMVGILLYRERYQLLFLPKQISCVLDGNSWHGFHGDNIWANMFCGCYVKFDLDKGKKCLGPNDCLSNNCVIEMGDKPVDGLYSGRCVEEVMESFYISKQPWVICGTASIEAGKIKEDNRFCVY